MLNKNKQICFESIIFCKDSKILTFFKFKAPPELSKFMFPVNAIKGSLDYNIGKTILQFDRNFNILNNDFEM